MTATPWDDFELHVKDAGEGEIVVLLHSSGMSGDQWRKLAERLVGDGFRAIVPDLTGSGRSPARPDGVPFRFEEDVAVVDRLLAKLARPAHLVGHSYGGLIALHAAALNPARALSLSLYDPVVFGVLDQERDKDAWGDLTRLGFQWGKTQAEHDDWLQSFVDYWGGSGSWAGLRDVARDEFRRVGWVAYEGARTLVADRTPETAYRSLSIPTLLLTGELTPLAERAVVARLAASLPSAHTQSIAGAGHMGPLTHGKQVNELIVAHLRGSK